jgi:hypothetical protein
MHARPSSQVLPLAVPHGFGGGAPASPVLPLVPLLLPLLPDEEEDDDDDDVAPGMVGSPPPGVVAGDGSAPLPAVPDPALLHAATAPSEPRIQTIERRLRCMRWKASAAIAVLALWAGCVVAGGVIDMHEAPCSEGLPCSFNLRDARDSSPGSFCSPLPRL